MNRFVRAAAAAALAVGGAGGMGCMGTGGSVARGVAPDGCATGGCATGGCAAGGGVTGGGAMTGGAKCGDGQILRTFYDPCWPERYNAAARSEVLAPFAAQVNNGHVLNQTIWNWYFVPGSDHLTPAGAAKLDSISHTRPGPDPRLYLQAARDIPATPENIDKLAALRDDLTAKRAAMVQRYMSQQPLAGGQVAYEIFVHDPVVEGVRADFITYAYRGQMFGYRGGILGATGTAATQTGGGGGGGGGGTGGGIPIGPSAGAPAPSAGSVPGM